MIPIPDEYIADEFYIDKIHYVMKDSKLIREINAKSRNYIKQLELGRMTSQVDALSIREKLLNVKRINTPN
jgi:hypothetical protein